MASVAGRCRRGFTLIELLVVIVILSVLAAIVFPVFSLARERARIAACASNLRQLGLAVQMYAEEYEGRFPVGDTFHNPQARLTEALSPYVKNTRLFYCPSGNAAGQADLIASDANWGSGNIGYLYWCYNSFTDTRSWPRWLPAGRRILSDRSPAECWLFSDWFKQEEPTAHPVADKSINFLTVGGQVRFWVKHPRLAFR